MTESQSHAIQRDKNTDDQRYLAFTLSKERYAIPLQQVKEVIGMNVPTPVPSSPSHFKGIINLRGQVISVIDLRVKLKMAKAEIGPETSIIILDLAPHCIGVIVDSIDCVLAVSADDLCPAPEIPAGQKDPCLIGVARQEKQLVLLLDVRATLSLQDLQAIKTQSPDAA